MADSITASPNCATCAKAGSDPGISLKWCAKCRTVQYCSRECQKENWKSHKKECATLSNESDTNQSPSTATSSGLPPKGLSATIDKPFHQLDARTWLHHRPEGDVYSLLIDTYRFRMADDYNFDGKATNDSIYGGAASGLQGFRRFLRNAESRGGLLPSWWSKEKAARCEALGIDRKGWSSLSTPIEKADVVDHYGMPLMPMQLRMFGEQVVWKWAGRTGRNYHASASEDGGSKAARDGAF